MHIYQVWMYVYLDCSCEHVQHARLVLHSRHSGYSVRTQTHSRAETSSTLLPPSDRHQCRSNLLSPPLRRQHVELRRRISCILHLDSDS